MNFLEQSLDGKNDASKFAAVILLGFIGGQFLGALPIFFFAQRSGSSSLNFESMGLSPNLGLVLLIFPFSDGSSFC